ncbi:MAG: membrane protein insertase YidC, partial [Candidatus Eisenbacteria bacterium]|nr:membrane protein insertase YidC [Candidatus Eisenbacteria bacterium]
APGCGGGGDAPNRWSEQIHEGMLQWGGVRNKYFMGALIPAAPREGRFVARVNPGRTEARARLVFPVGLDGSGSGDFQVYLGPLKHDALREIGSGLERAVDLGMKLIVPISKAILWAMTTLYQVIPNYGVVILIISVLSKIIFHPLTKKSLDSMRQMQLLKPEIDKLNEKFKDDPQRKNQEMMKLYKKHQINPVGGCLPLLVQMPVFLALYGVLYNVIEMRKADFVLWINDLSIPDTVGYVAGIPVNPLPILMTGSMILQQRLTPTDPRQATMALMMPVIFLFFFYSLPSGLVFYWTVNNVVSIIQQLWIKRKDEPVLSEKASERRRYAVASKK